MLKNIKQFSISRQKLVLLILEWSVGFRPAGSVWVLLLALRGFSLVEIGFAEAVRNTFQTFEKMAVHSKKDLALVLTEDRAHGDMISKAEKAGISYRR